MVIDTSKGRSSLLGRRKEIPSSAGYNLQWEGDAYTIALVGVVSRVNEGYVERYRKT